MEPISRRYRDRIMRMMGVSRGQTVISDKNVHQPGNLDILPFIDSMIVENLLPGSGIRGIEHLGELLSEAAAGVPCLLLLEHYSNFDLPVFHYLLRQAGPKGIAVADALLAIAGIKLNESNPVVLAFTEAYSRLVIYPSRSIEIIQRNLKDPKEMLAEVMRSTTVNLASMRALRAEEAGQHRPRLPLGDALSALGPEQQERRPGDRLLREVLLEDVPRRGQREHPPAKQRGRRHGGRSRVRGPRRLHRGSRHRLRPSASA